MVSTPLADPFGQTVPRETIDSRRGWTGLLDTNAPIVTGAGRRARTGQTLGLDADTHDVLERIVGWTRSTTAAECCALLQLASPTGTLQPRIVAGDALAFPLATAALNPLPSGQPVKIDLSDSRLAGYICSIPGFGALVVAWNRRAAEPNPGTLELAARLVASAIDQARAGVLNLATWRSIDFALSPIGDPVIARDATGRLLHISGSARALLDIAPGANRVPLREPALIRALDLRDQWGLGINPNMLPSARLRAGKPSPDLVVSARHHRAGRKWLLLHAEAIRDGHGKVTVVLTMLRDFNHMQRYGETHWLRSRITEHLHRRPIDLASIEHDIAAYLDGTCTIELSCDPPRPRRTFLTSPPRDSVSLDPDEGATELRLACGHLHSGGPAAPITIERSVAPLSPHAVTIPMDGDGEIIGHMNCHREAFRPCFDHEELKLLTELAEQIGLALAVSRLRESLHAGERMLVDIGQRLMDAEETERRRMALSIHDGVAQVAASVCQQLEIIAHRYEPSCDAESQELQRARDLARRTVQEARQLIAGLRPVTLDAQGLGAAVREEIEALRRDGWMVRYLDGLAGARFAADIELDIFRIVQEAMSNARKHARMTSIEVILEQRAAAVHFEVRDHGAGFDSAEVDDAGGSGSHVGLGGMRERIARIGGTLHIESAPAQGTSVKGVVPV